MNPASFEGSSDKYVNALNRLIDGEDWPRALDTARAWLAEDPQNPTAHRVAGQALVNLERYPEAQSHLERALAGNPHHAFTHRLASIVCFRRKDIHGADEHIQRALDLQPNDAYNWQHLASMRYQHGALDLAAQHARRALELQPNNPHIINLLALCNPHDAESQLAQYQRALSLDPENGVVHHNLGVYYLNVKRDYAAAEASFRQVLRRNPTDKLAQQNLLRVLRQRDRFYRALWAPLAVVELFTWGGKTRSRGATVGLLLVGLFIWKILWGIIILWVALIYPLQKAYEYLTLGDIRAEAGVLGARRGGLLGYRRWPFAVRFGILVAVMLAFWTGVYLLVRRAPPFDFALLWAGASLVGAGSLVFYGVRAWKKARLRRIARRSEKRLASRIEPAKG